MEKDENYSQAAMPGSFSGLEYFTKAQVGETSGDNNHNHNHNHNNNQNNMVDYMLNNNPHQQHNPMISSGFCGSNSLDKLSFADVMQFADFGPKLALNQARTPEEETGIDPVYFLNFPVLNDKSLQEGDDPLMIIPQQELVEDDYDEESKVNSTKVVEDYSEKELDDEAGIRVLEMSDNEPVQLRFLGEHVEKSPVVAEPKTNNNNNKRKRPRATKTSEEVESQRMTHIAVERNRRKQMNEHLRVLRSLMPGSYVQRGDQASIIGGAIEFVRELEQLLQCLESQKRRRLYGDGPIKPPTGDSSSSSSMAAVGAGAGQPPQPPFLPPLPLPNDQTMKLVDYESGLEEETADSKSYLADVEVKLLGFDAMIKILSRRRPGQLIKIIAALEDMQLAILHTNITTIDQTVLYSFNIKVSGEVRYTAEDIANTVQQIFNFIHANI